MAHAGVDPPGVIRERGHLSQGADGSMAPGVGGAAAWVQRQLLLERERWILWLPVGMGTGAAFYFVLKVEPPGWLALMPLLLVAALATARWILPDRPAVLIGLIGALALSAGFASAKLRTDALDGPGLAARGVHGVSGTVTLVEERPGGLRLTLQAPRISGLAPEATPGRIRFTVRGQPAVSPGDRVSARAVLIPPSGPAAPGDFDFARYAYFQPLAAVGYTLGPLTRIVPAETLSHAERLATLRQRIATAIMAQVQGAAGGVAAALLTGLRGGIPDRVWDDMQRAGIAHLLAISGLHLGLVAGTLFFSCRIGIALLPPLALRINGKKAAALVALAGAFIYLLLTGMTVPTQRAFIMTALALLAVMVDRNPFSMRLVAIAAVLVLVRQPDALLGASFQMSFAAVVGLIAAYETGIGRRPDGAGGLGWTLLLYLLGVALTTAIASAATAPFAVYQFGRLPAYGVVANLIAVPLTAFWIMPTGLLGLLLMPLGLEAVGFVPMGLGVGVVLDLAAWVGGWTHASIELAKPPLAALLAMVSGGLWLCLWRRPWRLLGLIGVAAGILLAAQARPPDLLIDETGTLAAARLDNRRVALAPWGKDKWVERGWLRRLGATARVPWPAPGERTAGLACTDAECTLERKGRAIAIAETREAVHAACMAAALVIARIDADPCRGPATLLDRRDLAAAQGLAIWLDEAGVRVVRGREARGERPWTD